MRHSFSRGSREYRVAVDEAAAGAEELTFRSQREAVAFLRRESHRAGALGGFRRVLAGARSGVEVGRLSDQEVLLRLGWMVAQRRVRIYHGQRLRFAYGADPVVTDEPSALGPVEGFGIIGDAVIAEPPLFDVAMTGKDPPLVEVELVLGPIPGQESDADDLDAAAQAATMRDAAEAGLPFCEECEKLKAAKAAARAQEEEQKEQADEQDEEDGQEEPEVARASDTPTDEAVANVDAAAQAAVLRSAAASGAPFCEECEKLEAAKQAAAAA
jgi:hypothetical protein